MTTIEVTSTADSGPGSLRGALEALNAAGGGTADLRSVTGLIALESALPEVRASVRLVGPESGALRVSGNGRHPILAFASGTTNEVSRLTLSDALATEGRHGGAISNAGVLVVRDCTLAGNRTRSAWGGAVYNRGHLVLLDSVLRTNVAEGEPGAGAPTAPTREGKATIAGGDGRGGAVYHDQGSLLASNCWFVGNRATGGEGGLETYGGPGIVGTSYGGPGGAATGGGLHARGGSVVLRQCRFEDNQALGGPGKSGETMGGMGGGAIGGAVNGQDTIVAVEDCRFEGNVAASGPSGGDSDWVWGGRTPSGSDAGGGALGLTRGTLELSRSWLRSNRVAAGSGGSGKYGSPGGAGHGGGLLLQADRASLLGSLLQGNRVEGGAGGGSRTVGLGGEALGGGVAVRSGTVLVENCTLSGNLARGADGRPAIPFSPAGQPGRSHGAGLAVLSDSPTNAGPAVAVRFVTVTDNETLPAFITSSMMPPYLAGVASGGGIAQLAGRVRLEGVVCAGNRATNSADLVGTFASVRRNLVGVPGDAVGLRPEDLVGVDPRLGPLGDHGGPTPTHPLLAESPALDALPPNFGPDLDQRGISRPQGAGYDLGAVEMVSESAPAPGFAAVRLDPLNGRVEWIVRGAPSATYSVEASENLTDWSPLGTVAHGGVVADAVGRSNRFYRFRPASVRP